MTKRRERKIRRMSWGERGGTKGEEVMLKVNGKKKIYEGLWKMGRDEGKRVRMKENDGDNVDR